MYIIVAYDVDAKRTEIFKKACQVYLTKVQNSVFEGELNEAQLMRLKSDLSGEVKENEKVRIWITSKILTRIRMGKYDQAEDKII
jgi:CRISPR-associated protein Cas2